MMSILKIQDLQVKYGANAAIKGVSLEVGKGEVRVILGANGAGKTTILNAIMGVLKTAGGSIEFPPGKGIQGLPPHRIIRLGIALCPERRGILAQMSVRENLEMGAYCRSDRAQTKRTLSKVFDMFPLLVERQEQLAGSLSGGEQQMLAISRGLMAEPSLFLMDEPSLGLAPIITAEIFGKIKQISETGLSILLVEQNAKQALKIADWVYVLETGVVKTEGTPATLLQDETIKKVYLGERE